MKYFLMIAALLIGTVSLSPALAQDAHKGSPWAAPFPGLSVPMTAEGQVDNKPTCFRVINKAPYKVLGSVYTNYYVDKERQKARHTSNFRLEPDAHQNFCSYGPYYDGKRLELVLRTVMPIFNCKTKIHGDVLIKGQRNDDGSTKTWAECLQ